MYAEKGYEFAEVKPEIKEVDRRTEDREPDLQHHRRPEGARSASVEFVGNKAISDGKLRGKMKENKAPGFFGFITGGGTYKEAKFEEDAAEGDRLLPRARLRQGAGRPARAEDPRGREGRQDALGRAADSGHRRAALQGRRAQFAGNTVVEERRAAAAVQVEQGRLLQREDGSRRASRRRKELYGSGGYCEFTGYPDLAFPNDPQDGDGDGDGNGAAPVRLRRRRRAGRRPRPKRPRRSST